MAKKKTKRKMKSIKDELSQARMNNERNKVKLAALYGLVQEFQKGVAALFAVAKDKKQKRKR